MSVIAYWSANPKQTGQTMSLVATATKMAVEHNMKILILSTQYNDNSLELCFGSMNRNHTGILKSFLKGSSTTAVDNGIEGVARLVLGKKLVPESISSYTRLIYRNRLEVLYGYKEEKGRTSREDYLKICGKYKEIVENANKYYDMVFVDLEKGLESEATKQILEISDLIVVNLEQKIHMIDEFIELRQTNPLFKGNKILLNLGRFDSYSKYSIANLARYTGMKKSIIAIPYNTLYFEAANEQKVDDLFLKMRQIEGADRNVNFIQQVKQTAEKVIYKIQELQMGM